MNDLAQRVFDKSIALLETRLKLKVKHAVLILEMKSGNATLSYGSKSDTKDTLLIQKEANRRVVNLCIGEVKGSQLVPCDRCLGEGQLLDDNDIFNTCPKCRGGGELFRSFATENSIENTKQEKL